MAIHSPARAMAIAEQVAGRYRITVDHLLCARWDRYVVHARAEVAVRIRDDLGWSSRAIGRWLGCSHPNVRKLFSYHKMRPPWAAMTGDVDPASILHLARDDQARRLAEAEQRAADAAREIDRLSGVHLTEALAEQLGLLTRCAIVLAICAENYPRVVRGVAILQGYDHACSVLGYGARNGATYDLMKKNFSSLDRAFAEQGWPQPTECGDLPASRRLTHAAADMLALRFGVPRRSQMMLAAEGRSPPIPSRARSVA
ncbi:MAG: hypothetical protein EBR82_08095 [Caulobacteraceae bacterium]|nr:hypothetical protein [Caulobacteraceae bacterium]